MLSAVRETVSSDVHLMLNFGCPAYLTPGWTAKDAVRIAGIAEKYNIFFLEEALKPDDVDGFAALTARANIKIATGESLTTLTEFQRFIDHRALDVIQPYAQQIGITQFVRIAYSAEQAGILYIPHCPWSPMAVAAHLQVLSGTTNGIMIEYPAFEYAPLGSYRRTWLESIHRRLIEHPLTVRDGYLQLPERPGLGLGQYIPEAIAAMEGLNPRE